LLSGCRIEAELGMSLWRRRLRLFKSIESMGGNLSVTQTAMERRRRCARRWREPAASRL